MHTAHTLTILVADDTDTDRSILEAMLRQEGHRVIAVQNGMEAVAAYSREDPDIVLLDALMPELDGFGAARQIKALAGEKLVPIIFLTSLTDSASLVQCLDAGGDDFLSKPYKRAILQAKIKSFNRMREMNSTILRQRNQIAQHNATILQEQAVAKQVFDNIAHSGCLDASNVKYFLSSLAVFNGDVVVAGLRPSGSMMVLLGDFTGHGLPAAIGAMPLASTFYGMVHKGFSMTDILREINGKLKAILPVGIFCCATMIDMNFRKRRVKVWNGGLPDCLIYRAASGHCEPVVSTHLPLGVLSNREFKDNCEYFDLELGDRFFMWSDGIHEARDAEGNMFGERRLHQIFECAAAADGLFDDILAAVHSFVGRESRDDDLSLIEIQMVAPEAVAANYHDADDSGVSLPEWTMSFEVKSASLRVYDPMPLLLKVLMEVPGLRSHGGTLFTVLSELYSNALEHGVLGLDSVLKSTPQGFDEYYRLRSQRLADVQDGYVRIHLNHSTHVDGGQLTILVEDSGEGFDRTQNREASYGGRGLTLVEQLCETVRYLNGGNAVEAIFNWGHDD